MEMPRWSSLWYYNEAQELLRAYEAIHGSTDGRVIPHDLPLPKLSDVLRCARLAREQPEMWELAKVEALLSLEIWDSEYRSKTPYLSGPFLDWFRLKNDLYDYRSDAFIIAVAVLREWAHPDYDGDEVAALRRLLRSNEYIDDLADKMTDESGKA